MKRVVIGSDKVPTIRVLKEGEDNEDARLISDRECSRFITAQRKYNEAFLNLVTVSREIELKKEIFEKTDKGRFIKGIVMSAEGCTVGYATKLAQELLKMGPRSARLAEIECTRNLTEYEKKNDSEMDFKVVEIGKELGLKAYRQGDPRGQTIRVVVGRQYTTNWDGETVGCG